MIKFLKKHYQIICALIALILMLFAGGVTCTNPTENWLLGLILLLCAAAFVSLGKLGTYKT